MTENSLNPLICLKCLCTRPTDKKTWTEKNKAFFMENWHVYKKVFCEKNGSNVNVTQPAPPCCPFHLEHNLSDKEDKPENQWRLLQKVFEKERNP